MGLQSVQHTTSSVLKSTDQVKLPVKTHVVVVKKNSPKPHRNINKIYNYLWGTPAVTFTWMIIIKKKASSGDNETKPL